MDGSGYFRSLQTPPPVPVGHLVRYGERQAAKEAESSSSTTDWVTLIGIFGALAFMMARRSTTSLQNLRSIGQQITEIPDSINRVMSAARPAAAPATAVLPAPAPTQATPQIQAQEFKQEAPAAVVCRKCMHQTRTYERLNIQGRLMEICRECIQLAQNNRIRHF